VKLVKRWKKDPTSIAAAITLPAKAMSANLRGVRGKLDRREVADGTTLKLGKIAGIRNRSRLVVPTNSRAGCFRYAASLKKRL